MGNGKLRAALVATPAAIAAIAIASHGCGSARKVEGGGPPGTSELNLEITSVLLPQGPADGPKVTFRATDRTGAAIDVLAELAKAASKTVPYLSNGPRFTFAQMEPDGSATSWYESTVNPAPFTPPAGATSSPAAATQPGSQQAPAGNPSSRITANGDGTFTFAFGAPTTPESRRDASKPLVAGMWLERIADRPGGGPKRWPSAATRITTASGAPAAPHEAVADVACNTCHVQLRAHDRRETVQLCKTCHAGGAGVVYKDPESGENLDFRAMIHRIHSGANLPSVRAGGHFFIVGFQQRVSDFSATELPALREATECTVCHRGGADSDAWKTKASFVACTACHDNLRFGSAGKSCELGVDDVQPCDHKLSPGTVTESSSCAQCHTPGATSPPIGPDIVHRNDLVQLASRWKYEIVQVTVGDDRKPVVQFRVSKDGAPDDIKGDPAWQQGAASRLFVDMAWPTTEITNEGAGFVDATVKSPQFPSGTPGPGQPVQVNALTASTPVGGQTNVFQVTSPTAVPPQLSSLRVVLEGHPAEGTGASALRIPVPNAVQDVAVGGGTPAARREIVSADTCNACHGELSAHGANRNATPAVCVACHTPRTTDFVRVVQARNRTTPPPIPSATEAPVDFKVLVHEIHAADIRKTPVTVFGFGGNPTTFPAAFPGSTGRCTICHVGDSYRLPLRPEVEDTTTEAGDPAVAGDPAEKRLGRTIAVCTSCHDMVRFDTNAGRPFCNTLVPVNSAECTHSGGAQEEGSCASCHAAGSAFDTARVHPIAEKPQ
jgi:OmcA/MtrC family decaheme c-type cytochrome